MMVINNFTATMPSIIIILMIYYFVDLYIITWNLIVIMPKLPSQKVNLLEFHQKDRPPRQFKFNATIDRQST